MQSTNLTRSAPQASITTAAGDLAKPTRATDKTTAGTAQRKDDSTAAFANELAQVADDQQPLAQPDAKAPAEPASEADAEQWLLHMLGQQSAQLQARDAEQGTTDETQQAINAAIQALPTTLAGQELPATEQAANDQPLIPPSAEDLAAEQLASQKLPSEQLISGQLAAEKLTVEKFADALALPTKTTEQTLEEANRKLGLHAAGENRGRDVNTAQNVAATAAANSTGDTRRVKLDPALVDTESANQPLITQLERLAAGANTSDVGTRIDSTLTNTPVTESATLERTLKLQGPETKWGEQLLQALRDNVELQMQQQRVQNTTIRLDPPELGSMEITLTHEQGRLNVQISAQQSDVVRLLQQTSDRLRHELVAQNFTQVDVEISGGQTSQQQSQRDQARLFNEQSVLANQHEAGHPDADHLTPEQQKSVRHSDVLVTV